ncbi:helix-turn-helix domain-containing protein [Pelagibius sp. Alg239-R121]|uniref:winged helix-turn-helix transcriptional regulator n=1 Tax=Pelagibius sp. Alg239-R121 TaxID=2993448 RepID=UPI002AC32F2C|nr:helix-turn-helix domain-containing protein [Pelagibius sp. Alg239-R121]
MSIKTKSRKQASATSKSEPLRAQGGPVIAGTCPMPDIAQLIGGKWKLIILQILIFQGMKRFNELRRLIDGITQTMLTSQLRALERDGLVSRKVYAEVPPRVEYRATQRALDLQEMFQAMHNWWLKGEEEGVKRKPS